MEPASFHFGYGWGAPRYSVLLKRIKKLIPHQILHLRT